MADKNIFVVGYEDFNVQLLRDLPVSASAAYHPALYQKEMQSSHEIPALGLLATAIERIEKAGVEPDAIITYWDFPGTVLSAMLNARFGLIGPSPRSVFKCEHKAWSRAEQRKSIPEHIPIAMAFDPRDEDAFHKLNLLPPFWIKPVKGFRSWLSFRVNDRIEFEQRRAEMQKDIDGIYQPFVELMRRCHMPDLITTARESCIAESSLDGHVCTVEGYVHDGNAVIYGIVDSIREKNSNSFQRYQYPSLLPTEVQYSMADLSRRVITQIGLDDSCFNIEFFYNQTYDHIRLLEINPRTSQSHSDLFAKVHGHSQFELLVQIATGNRPRPMELKGPFRMAAKYMLRVSRGGRVQQVPSEEQITALAERFPGTKVKLLVSEGDRLEDLLFQDAYTYEIADIFLGGNDELDIYRKYQQVVAELSITIE